MRYSAHIAVLVSAAALAGCVERTMEIRSDPPGAAVWLNHRYVGRTPVTGLEFTHHGEYQVTLRAEGYRPLTATESVMSPLWEKFPVDLVAEVLPWKIRTRRVLEYELERITLRSVDEVLADAARERKRLESELPPPTASPPPPESTADTAPFGAEGSAKESMSLAAPPDLAEESGGPPRPSGPSGASGPPGPSGPIENPGKRTPKE